MPFPGQCFSSPHIQAETITASFKDADLVTVFKYIEGHTHYGIMYNSDDVKSVRHITASFKDADVGTVLSTCLAGYTFSWKITGTNIIIIPIVRVDKVPLMPAKDSSISGVILDKSTGQPIPGVTVRVAGTSSGAVSDAKGAFTVKNAGDGAILTFTSIGYDKLQQAASGKGVMQVIMSQTINALDERQVIAYGTTTRRFSTSAISSVSNKEIEEQPVSNILSALEGRVPGLYIQQVSGVPDGNIRVNLRGQNSIANGNNPFYIVDGVPYAGTTFNTVSVNTNSLGGGSSPLSYLNPSEIERIDVLKDADATAIYGSRGSNGVILITTKKGKPGKTNFQLNAFSGVGNVSRVMKLLNASQYQEMRHEAFKNDQLNPSTYDFDVNGSWDTTRSTDWQKVLIGGTAKMEDLQGSLSGGSALTQFLVSTGYHKESSVFPGNFYNDKVSAAFNLQHTTEDQKFRLNFAANFMGSKNTIPSVDLTTAALTLPPDAPALYDSTGQLNWEKSTWSNPLAAIYTLYSSNASNLISNMSLNYMVIKGLNLKANLGYTQTNTNETSTTPRIAQDPANPYARSSAMYGTGNFKTLLLEPQAQYQRAIGFANMDILVGFTYQDTKSNTLSQYGYGFTNDALLGSIGAVPFGNLFVLSNSIVDYKYAAIFARLNFIAKEKYILNLTGRRDGSSRFGPDRRYGNFGSIGAAWIFTNEHTFKNPTDVLSFGKIRASYGLTGNDQTTDYQFLDSYSTAGVTYLGVSGLIPTRLYNPSFGWETNKKLEFGLELGFFKNKLLVQADYYRNRSSDQLVNFPLAPTTGSSSITANLPAVLQNTGFEMEVQSKIITGKRFTWNASVNFTAPDNKLVSFPNLEKSGYRTTYAVGKSLNVRYVYDYKGVDQQTGLYTFSDSKGNITSSPSPDNDRKFDAVVAKRYFGGLYNNFKYGSFQLDVFIQFVKQTGQNDLYSTFVTPGHLGNQPRTVLARWKQPGDNSNVQQYTSTYQDAYTSWYSAHQYGSNSITDASFIRLKNVAISYFLPKQFLQKCKLSSAQIFGQSQNLLTFTKYLGLDPEEPYIGHVPSIRMVTFGIRVNL